MAYIGFIPILSGGSVVLGFALVAINALGVVLTVHTATATLIETVNIQRQTLAIDFLVINTLIGMTMTITS